MNSNLSKRLAELEQARKGLRRIFVADDEQRFSLLTLAEAERQASSNDLIIVIEYLDICAE